MPCPPPLDCSVPDCNFKTPDNLPNYDLALRALEIHSNAVHNSGRRDEGLNQNMKVTKCVEWVASQTYEAFERDLKVWRKCAKIDSAQQNMLFIEMLKRTENAKVREFYEIHLMNSLNTEQDIDSLMKKFKEKFGRSEKTEWRLMIDNLKDFKWESGESTEHAMDRLKELRTRMTKLKVRDNLDKFLIMMFLKSGERESNLEKAEIMKIEEEIEKGKFQWDVVEKTFRKYKIEHEQDKINETHFMSRSRKSSQNNRSSSRECRSQQRSSTPNNYKSPCRFVKTRETGIVANDSSINNSINETLFISTFGEEIKVDQDCVEELFWAKNEKGCKQKIQSITPKVIARGKKKKVKIKGGHTDVNGPSLDMTDKLGLNEIVRKSRYK